jgi:hypothetical protein
LGHAGRQLPTRGGAGYGADDSTRRDAGAGSTLRRELDRRFGGDHDKVVAAYAAAERRGDVKRASNVRHMEPAEYASRLYADGVKKGWMR